MSYIDQAIREIDEKIDTLQRARTALEEVGGMGQSVPSRSTRAATPAPRTGTRKPMSEEAKQRIREAQQRRWKKVGDDAVTQVQGDLLAESAKPEETTPATQPQEMAATVGSTAPETPEPPATPAAGKGGAAKKSGKHS